MTGEQATALDIYHGWEDYQNLLITAITPLTPEQLSYRTAPSLRGVAENVLHVIGARARWCQLVVGLADPALPEYARWDRADMPARAAPELIEGLRATWGILRAALASWTLADLSRTFPNTDREPGEPEVFTLQWILWHLIEHDLHHGGEISQILGAHGVPGLDI